MTASLHHIWSMVNTQQIVVMTGLFATTFPANLNIFFRYLMSIAAFDLIELTEFLDNYLGIEPTGPYNQAFDLIGLDSLLFVNNMGTMTFVYIIYIILAFLTLILYSVRFHLNYKIHYLVIKMKENLFFKAIVTIIFETAQMIYLCFLTQFKDKNLIKEPSHLAHFGVSIFLLMFITLIPYYIMYMLRKYILNIGQKHLDKKFGSFFSNLALVKRGKWVLDQPTFFLVRRAVLAYSVTVGDFFFVG